MKKYLSLALAAVMIIGIFAGCSDSSGDPGTTAATQAPAGTTAAPSATTTAPDNSGGGLCQVSPNANITLVSYADGASLFPLNTSATMESQNCGYVYETLLNLTDDGYDWRLATGVEVSDNNLEYTFSLRQGISFTDGTPWNAESCKANLEHMSDQTNGYYRSSSYKNIVGIDAVDEYTVKVTLDQVYAPFLNVLAGTGAYMMSPSLIEKGAEYCAMNMTGTGQYIFKERTVGEKVVFELNRDWWGYDPEICGGKAIVEPDMGFNTVTIRPISEEATRVSMLLSGEADVIESFGYNNIAVVEGAGFKYLEKSGIMVAFLYMNNQKGATKDVRVREAIAKAIDYDMLNEVVYGNTYQRGRSVSTAAMNYYEPQAEYGVDLERSRALLAEAGYNESNVLKLTAWSENDNTDIARCEFIKQQLAQVGIDLTVNCLDGGFLADNVSSYQGKPEDTEWDIYVRGYSVTSRDADGSVGRFASTHYPPTGGNYSFYTNERFDELVKKGASTTDTAVRAECYSEAQKLIWDEFGCVPMLVACYPGACNPKTVENVNFDGGGGMTLTYGRYLGN